MDTNDLLVMSNREMLERILINTHRLLQGDSLIMSQLDDANAAVDAVTNALDTIIGDDASVLAELKTLQAQPPATVDLSGIISKLQIAGAKATAEITNLQAVLPAAGATAPTGNSDTVTPPTTATTPAGADPGTSVAPTP